MNRRVCCVYVEARIVYVCVPLVYVETDRIPFVYRHFQYFSCMLRQFYEFIKVSGQCCGMPLSDDAMINLSPRRRFSVLALRTTNNSLLG